MVRSPGPTERLASGDGDLARPPSSGSLPRFAWIGILLVLALQGLHFCIQSTHVRLATPDDLAFQTVANQGNAEAYLANNAFDQGRFFYSTPLYHFALISPYEVRNAGLFSLFRTLAYLGQIGLAASLAARLMQSAALGATVALFLAATLHIPLTFFLLLSFPPAWIGFSALLGALHCHLTYLRQPGLCSGLLAATLYLLATLMHDVFVIYLPLFIALSWLRGITRWQDLLRQNVGPLTVAIAYVVVHRSFAAEFPSIYEGTQFSPGFAVAAKVLVRQIIGVTPGFELFVNRAPVESSSALFRSGPSVLATLGALSWAEVLLALLSALALTFSLSSCFHVPIPRARFWPWAVGFAVLANLPIAFSAKYQVFILHREYPYGYAYFSFYFLGIAAIAFLVWLGQRVAPGTRLWLNVAVGAGALAVCLSALASNRRVLEILSDKYN